MPASDPQAALAAFDPRLRRWFAERFGQPTDIQQRAWPHIAAGEHVLVSAPTGSGKTLTAFLWALDRLLTGVWQVGRTRVLYISPLKALNTDIRRNLSSPLAELVEIFRAEGGEPPEIRALVRSGDTPQSERRKMLRRPPEILITTPESLNILLTSKSGRELLGGLETVILDEIHAVVASKRGTHLITAVDRLVPLAGDFQRLAISATVRPLDQVAAFVGGYQLIETGGEPSYRPRQVRVVRSTAGKDYRIRVRHPRPPAAVEAEDEVVWESLARDFKRQILTNRSTLLFANSRRLTEKITRLINDQQDEDLAYSHHGSLSREVRSVVERRLKDGELSAIVATSSLELGIDIGALDEVLLIQTPRAISAAVQRVGRAGHGVGETSRGVIYPSHGRDFLDAAVVARAILDQDIEPMQPIRQPLDVLAQVVLSMVVAETWQVDRLYAFLRTSQPYHQLRRRQLDLVLEMLAGRYADSRIRELRPRLRIDRVDGTVRARRGVERLLYLAGGTIPDRGYFTLRVERSMAKLGELDEEFVWERSVGDSFVLGTQAWRIRKITHNDVLVVPGHGGAALAPFWRADAQDRGAFLSEKVARLLQEADDHLGRPEFRQRLIDRHCLEAAAADRLVEFLQQQQAATGKLPHRRRLLVEHCWDGAQGGRRRVILHTFWGGTVNRPFATALAAAWDQAHDDHLEVYHSDDNVLLILPGQVSAEELFALVPPESIERLLRQRLEATGFFGARFRAAASTALLLPRQNFRQRLPLWVIRQRAKKLLDGVACYGDFPILVETWRSCLQDEFDLETLKLRLTEVAAGEVEIADVRTTVPSPFAADLLWQETNFLMYEDDSPRGELRTGVRPDLLRELVFSAQLRPRLPAPLVERFRRKVQRTLAGYAPRPGDDLADWIDERLLLSREEWRELLAAVESDHGEQPAGLIEELGERVLGVCLPGAKEAVVVSTDRLPYLLDALGLTVEQIELVGVDDPRQAAPKPARRRLDRLIGRRSAAEAAAELALVLSEWLRFHGPLAQGLIGQVWGFDDSVLERVLTELAEGQRLVVDLLQQGVEAVEICDADNLEILLRWLRLAARPAFEPLGLEQLPLWLARHQGLTEPGSAMEDLQHSLERLFGYPAPVESWESNFLPARLEPYYQAWLDSLLRETQLLWTGVGKGRLSFVLASDLELLHQPPAEGESAVAESAARAQLLPPGGGWLELAEIAAGAGLELAAAAAELWRLAWSGRVTSGSFAAVRQGIAQRFELPAQEPRAAARRGGRRRGLDRWRPTGPRLDSWRALEANASQPLDALEREELAKDRARWLVERYGVVFRELLARELPALRWSRVFRALRLMELSGEVLAGQFFDGIPGLQFASPGALCELRQGLPEDVIYWLAANDPASLCGVDLEALKGNLPARLPSTHLVFHGSRLVLVSKRHAAELQFNIEPEHPRLAEYGAVLKVLLTRESSPRSRLAVDVINDQPAHHSPYCAPLGKLFRLTREGIGIKLWKRY